jgi:4-hydroxy-4-methyl-2-oxoglutarate aldolase
MRTMKPAELDRWRGIPAAVMSDERDHQGVLAAIRPLFAGRPFAGQAFTIRIDPAGEPPRVALARIDAGACIVIDARTSPEGAVWGGSLIRIARERGVHAIVVDGSVRDLVDLRESGLAVCSRAVTPRGPQWRGMLQQPIQCGGISVEPGDLVIGDDDGVVAVPLAAVTEELLQRCNARVAREADGGRA